MKFLLCVVLLAFAANASVINRRQAQTDLGAKVEADLKKVLAEIEAAVDGGKTVAHEVLEKGHALLEQAKTIGGQVWHAAQGELGKLNDAASTVFSGFLKGASSLWHELQHIFGKRSVERRFLLDDLKAFNARISQGLQTILHDVGAHLHDFNTYIVNVFKEKAHEAQPVLDDIKGLAENFLNATAAKSKEVMQQAKTFFEPYKHDLGEIWGQIECSYNHIVHGATQACTRKRSDERRFLLDDLKAFNARISQDLQTIFHDVGARLHDFNAYIVNLFKEQAKEAQPIIDTIKGLAHDFLNATAAKSKDVMEQAKTFFEPYKHDLGELWGQIECSYNHIVHGATQACHTTFKRAAVTDLGTQVSTDLQHVLSEIETAVTAGKTVAHDLLLKGHTLLEQAKTIGGQVWHAAQGEISKLSDGASTIFSGFLKEVSNIWNEIKHLFGKRATTEAGTQVHAELQKVLGEIETAVKQGETVAHDLLQKSHTLIQQAKTIGGEVWNLAKEELAKLGGPAGTVLNDFLKGASSLWNEIKHLFGKRATEAGTQVHAELQKVLGEIETAVKQGETVAHDLLQKSHTLIQQAKTIGGEVWTLAKAELAKLSTSSGTVLNDFLKGASSLWNEIKHLFG